MKVLADTSIWIDHFRRGDAALQKVLDRGEIVIHPFIIGELVLGRLSRIAEMMADLKSLPRTNVASFDEVLEFIARRKLPGSGIGYVDAHLLAAAALTPEVKIWTRDKRLLAAVRLLGFEATLPE